MKKWKKNPKANVYEIINAKFIEKLELAIEHNEKPFWKKTWLTEYPKNAVTERDYRGVNLWILDDDNFKSPYWLSFKQAMNMGGRVKETESKNYERIVYWNFKEFKLSEEEQKRLGKETKSIPFLRYYRVYNAEQCSGLPDKFYEPAQLRANGELKSAEDIVSGFQNKPVINFGGNNAYYSPLEDRVNVPEKGRFESSEFFYSTLFHELIHSTGSSKRLSRFSIGDFGDRDAYGKEELVAEFGATYLCNIAGISNESVEKNNLAYLKNWLSKIQQDPKLIISAASRARKASEHILGDTSEKEEEESTENQIQEAA